MTTISLSFCETAQSSGKGPWHIRILTKQGQKFGGEADTNSLCGREVSWDLEVELTPHHLENNTCPECRRIYKSLVELSEKSTGSADKKV